MLFGNNLKEIVWHKVAEHINFLLWQSNNMCLVEVNGKKITLIKTSTGFYATAHKCPHASGIMADGFIDALNNIVCPLHRYKFNLATGRNVTGEGYFLKTYPTRLENNMLYIGL